MQRVPAQRQPLRHGERGAPGGDAVHVPRRHPDVLLDGVHGLAGSRFQLHVQAGSGAVPDVDRNQRGFTLLDHDGGRQHPPPRRQFRLGQGSFDQLVGMRRDAERRQDLDQGVRGDAVRQPVPAMERRAHAVRVREALQEMLVHGPETGRLTAAGRNPAFRRIARTAGLEPSWMSASSGVMGPNLH